MHNSDLTVSFNFFFFKVINIWYVHLHPLELCAEDYTDGIFVLSSHCSWDGFDRNTDRGWGECSVPEKLHKVRSKQHRWVHHTFSEGLRRVEQTETIRILRQRRKKRGLIKAWVSAAVTCILNDVRLAVPGNIRPVCFDHGRAGRYLNHIQFISIYEGDQILIWLYPKSEGLHTTQDYLLIKK